MTLITKHLQPTQQSPSPQRKGNRSLCYPSVLALLTRSPAAKLSPPFNVRPLSKTQYHPCRPVRRYPCNRRKCNHQQCLPFVSLRLVLCVLLHLLLCLRSRLMSLTPSPRPRQTLLTPLPQKAIRFPRMLRLSHNQKLRHNPSRNPSSLLLPRPHLLGRPPRTNSQPLSV